MPPLTEERIETVEQRLSDLEQKLNNIDTRLTGARKDLDLIRTKKWFKKMVEWGKRVRRDIVNLEDAVKKHHPSFKPGKPGDPGDPPGDPWEE